MIRRIAPALLLVVLASCSSPADNSFLPDRPDARGAALGPNGAFAPTSSLAWSATTGEIVGTAPPASGGALIAMNSTTGTLRPIDSDAPLSVHLSADGTTVVYDAFEGVSDTLALRRVGLSGGIADRVTYAVGLAPHAFAVDMSGGAVAWSRQSLFELEPDSIRVEIYPVPLLPGASRATDPTRGAAFYAALEPGTPALFSPAGSELLYHPGSEPSALSRWSSTTLTSAPFPLGLPAGARGTALRWDAGGVKALYAIGASELWLRDATAGSDARLLLTPGDSIVATTPTWSPDGTKAAVWTLEYLQLLQVTQARLYLVDVPTRTAAVVAMGTDAPGAIAFSPDSKRVGYLFGSQVRAVNVPAPNGPRKIVPTAIATRGGH